MGNISAGSASSAAAEIERIRDEDDFWYSMVEFISPFLPSQQVFAWNRDRVKQIILEISTMDPTRDKDFRATSPFKLDEQIRLKTPNFPMWMRLRILELDSKLAKLRYRLVPARLTEENFWTQYAEQVIVRLRHHIIQGENESVPQMANGGTRVLIDLTRVSDYSDAMSDNVSRNSSADADVIL